MAERVKDAFDEVKAGAALVQTTETAVLAQMRRGKAPKRRRLLVPVLAVAACLLLAAGLGAHHLYFTPTTVVSIDVNPSLEMDINRFDKVIALEGYNDDGQALAKTLDVVHLSYDQAVDAVLADPAISERLAAGEELSIAVVQTDEAQGQAVLQYVSACTASHQNAHCYDIESSEAHLQEAHAAGLSCGKYRAYLELAKEDPSITPEDVQGMTMREIRDLLVQYEGTSGAGAQTEGGQGNGQGNGYGYGQGGHHREGGRHGGGHE